MEASCASGGAWRVSEYRWEPGPRSDVGFVALGVHDPDRREGPSVKQAR